MTAVFYPICVHKQLSKLHGCSSLASQMCVMYQPVKDFPCICFNMLPAGRREGERDAWLFVSAESALHRQEVILSEVAYVCLRHGSFWI
jgi:hypothetical protein